MSEYILNLNEVAEGGKFNKPDEKDENLKVIIKIDLNKEIPKKTQGLILKSMVFNKNGSVQSPNIDGQEAVVIVIDDDRANTLTIIVKKILPMLQRSKTAKDNFRIEIANNPKEAIDKINNEKYINMMTFDLNMDKSAAQFKDLIWTNDKLSFNTKQLFFENINLEIEKTINEDTTNDKIEEAITLGIRTTIESLTVSDLLSLSPEMLKDALHYTVENSKNFKEKIDDTIKSISSDTIKQLSMEGNNSEIKDGEILLEIAVQKYQRSVYSLTITTDTADIARKRVAKIGSNHFLHKSSNFNNDEEWNEIFNTFEHEEVQRLEAIELRATLKYTEDEIQGIFDLVGGYMEIFILDQDDNIVKCNESAKKLTEGISEYFPELLAPAGCTTYESIKLELGSGKISTSEYSLTVRVNDKDTTPTASIKKIKDGYVVLLLAAESYTNKSEEHPFEALE